MRVLQGLCYIRQSAVTCRLPAVGVSAATLDAAGSDPAALERAITTAMPHFVKDWPQLPGMLLQGAVEHIIACVPGTAAAAAAAPGSSPGQPQLAGGEAGVASLQLPAAAWAAWVTRILPPARDSSNGEVTKQQQKQQAGAKAPQGLVPGWVPSTDLLRHLVAQCLPALLACSHQAWLDWTTAGSCSSNNSRKESATALATAGTAVGQDIPGGDSACEALEPLQSTLRLLLGCWQSGGATLTDLARCTALQALAQAPPAQQRSRSGAPGRTGAALSRNQPRQQQGAPQPNHQEESTAVGTEDMRLSGVGGAVLALERQLEAAGQRALELCQKRTAEPVAEERWAEWQRRYGMLTQK